MNEQHFSIGHRLRIHCPTVDGDIIDRDATVRGYENGEILVRFDDQSHLDHLSNNWAFDMLPHQPVSHWQVWEISQGDQLVKDAFDTPIQAEAFAKQQQARAHWKASRRDDYVPSPQFMVRSVPMEVEQELDQ